MDFHPQELFIQENQEGDTNQTQFILGKCQVKYKHDIEDLEAYLAESSTNYYFEFAYDPVQAHFVTAFPNHPYVVERRKELEERHKIKKVLSVFSGSGGMDLGFQWAGVKANWAVELDKSAAETFARNFPNVRVLKEDAIPLLQLTMWVHGRGNWKELDLEQEYDSLGFIPELDDEWMVEAILDWRYVETGTRVFGTSEEKEFFVKWRGYGEDVNSWVHEYEMNCKDLINLFAHKHFVRTSQKDLDEWKTKNGKVPDCIVVLSDNENSIRGSQSDNNNGIRYFHNTEMDYTHGLDDLSDNDPEKKWQVEKILNHRRRKGTNEYLIKWESFPHSQNSWEPAEHIDKTLITTYRSKLVEEKQRKAATKVQTKVMPSSDVSYMVSSIVDVTVEDNELMFLLEWKDQSPDSWTSENYVRHVPHLVEAIKQKKKKELPCNPWLMYGGPPCQGFSRANHARELGQQIFVTDTRNHLIPKTIKYIKFFRPPYIILENVPGMLDGENPAWKIISKAFLMQGYQIRTGVLSADCYGVPQERCRLFFVAALPEVTLPEFPRPTHEGYKMESNAQSYVSRNYWFQTDKPIRELSLQKPVTIRGALSDLPEPGRNPNAQYVSAPTNLYQALLRLGNPSTVVSQHLGRNSCKALPPSWNSPAATVKASKPIHPHGRTCTVREASRLQSFPDWIKFSENEREAFRQIGNAVPPLLAFHVAKEYMKANGQKIPDTEITRIIKTFGTTTEVFVERCKIETQSQKDNQKRKRDKNNTNYSDNSMIHLPPSNISSPNNSNHDINASDNNNARSDNSNSNTSSKRAKYSHEPATIVPLLDEIGSVSLPEELEPDRPQTRATFQVAQEISRTSRASREVIVISSDTD